LTHSDGEQEGVHEVPHGYRKYSGFVSMTGYENSSTGTNTTFFEIKSYLSSLGKNHNEAQTIQRGIV
jgi:hypothetical protein